MSTLLILKRVAVNRNRLRACFYRRKLQGVGDRAFAGGQESFDIFLTLPGPGSSACICRRYTGGGGAVYLKQRQRDPGLWYEGIIILDPNLDLAWRKVDLTDNRDI